MSAEGDGTVSVPISSDKSDPIQTTILADKPSSVSSIPPADPFSSSRLNSLPAINGSFSSPNTGRMSSESAAIVEESLALLGLHSSTTPSIRIHDEPGERPNSPDFGLLTSHSLAHVRTPRFKRIDFDDRLEDINPKKPAAKSWEESIKDSYSKAKRAVELNKDEHEFLSSSTLRESKFRPGRDSSPFRNLDSTDLFVPSVRSSASVYHPPLPIRSRIAQTQSMNNVFAGGSGPYCAPAVDSSQGIESLESRYERKAYDAESLLMKALPGKYRTITTREFRRAPEPSAGSASERDDYDFSMYTPRPYYSRPNRDDPDYFDFDLQHSVDMFKRPEGRYVPKKPQEWESKLLAETTTLSETPISSYMFSKGDSDWRINGTSYLSAALRTPKFWEQRFESIGKHVRETNPISLDSINRNRPVTSRFTEYRDPDFDDYDGPDLGDD